jgi:HAMP domain-containing protein
MGKAASKAKAPLLAGGGILAGAAGGMAIGAMRSRHSQSQKVLGIKIPQGKRVKVRSRDFAKAAREVGTLGQSVGELATELRHAREESDRNGKHRSPVEVVLDGLTTRR